MGKVNVGKSMLYQVIFPKRADESVDINRTRREAQATENSTISVFELGGTSEVTSIEHGQETEDLKNELDLGFSLLPPLQPDQQYPVMPIVSHLPCTTASPIRIRFGKSRGELVDLPGLERSSLDEHVLLEHRSSLVMRDRARPKRETLRAGSSILLGGGLVRITPLTPDLIFMVHAFMPLSQHKTSNEKARAWEAGERDIQNIDSIVEPESLRKMKSAGRFRLTTDLTKTYSGPLTRRSDVGLSIEKLPFSIYATDILLEGVGWIEIVAQVRKPKQAVSQTEEMSNSDPPAIARLKDAITSTSGQNALKFHYPEVEIFTPGGRYIAQRDCIGAYALGGPKPVPVHKRSTRPRRSIRSLKRSLAGRNKSTEAATTN